MHIILLYSIPVYIGTYIHAFKNNYILWALIRHRAAVIRSTIRYINILHFFAVALALLFIALELVFCYCLPAIYTEDDTMQELSV